MASGEGRHQHSDIPHTDLEARKRLDWYSKPPVQDFNGDSRQYSVADSTNPGSMLVSILHPFQTSC